MNCYFIGMMYGKGREKLEAQWAEAESHTCHFVLRKLYTKPSIGASFQIPIYLSTVLEKIFLIGQSQTGYIYFGSK
jgi:hypothetical protein